MQAHQLVQLLVAEAGGVAAPAPDEVVQTPPGGPVLGDETVEVRDRVPCATTASVQQRV
jgi:hypothetical protein